MRRAFSPSGSQQVGDAAGHAGREVAADRAEHGDDAAGHVLAAVVADALDDGGRARVAHREALAGAAADEQLARRSRRTASCCRRRCSPSGRSRRRPAGARRCGRPRGPCRRSRWPGPRGRARGRGCRRRRGSGRRCPCSRSVSAPSASASGPRRRTSSPESIAPTARSVLRTRALDRRPARRAPARRRPGRAARGRAAPPGASPGTPAKRAGEPSGPTAGESSASRSMPAPPSLGLAQQVGAADEIVEPPHAELRHQLAHLLGHEQQVVHDVLGRAGEAPAQLGILRRDADRAGVEVADAHHDAARRDQRGGRERRTPRRRAARRSTTSRPVRRPPSTCSRTRPRSAVADQHLLRLGQAELPGHAGVPDRRGRRGAGAAVVAGDHDVVGAGLGDAGGDGADARVRDELDADLGRRVDAAQVVDQLRQVLDRVDVVVRRRRDQARRRASSGAGARSRRRPCGRAAARPRRAWRPARP